MSDMGQSLPRGGSELAVGPLLSGAMRLLRDRFGLFFGIALIAGALSEIARSLLVNAVGGDGALAGAEATSAALWIGVGGYVIDLLAYAVIFTVIGYGVVSASFGRRVGLGEAIGESLGRIWRAALSLIAGSIVIALGLVLLVVPGLVAAVWLFVAAPAAVVEELGPFQSLSRSASLTEGSRWRILQLMLVLVAALLLIGFLALGVVLALFGGASAPGNVDAAAAATLTGPGWIIALLMGLALDAALTAYMITLTFLAYLRLVEIKEGSDPGAVSGVFE